MGATPLHLQVHQCGWGECGRKYSTLGNLRSHQRVHRGELRFHCSEAACGKAFLSSYALRVHTRYQGWGWLRGTAWNSLSSNDSQ